MPFDELDSHLSRSLSNQLGRLAGNSIAGVIKCHYPVELRDNLFQNLQTLRSDIGVPLEDACESSARFCEALHKPEVNRVGPGTEDDRDVCRRPLCC
jgi:hypothetical protein